MNIFDEQFERSRRLWGDDNMQKIFNAKIIVFGIGGVGGYVVEALARAGIGSIDIVDDDCVTLSNINRQIIAVHSTVGQAKVDVMKNRILDINPACNVGTHKIFFLPENSNQFDFKKYDYIIDCIDTVKAKIQIIKMAKEADVPIISAMGAGNKIDPCQFKIADISKTSVCPLARTIRAELKKLKIKNVKCVYSTEQPRLKSKDSPASNSFVPSVAGLLIASQVIKDITAL